MSVGALKLGGAKFAGGKIKRGKASGVLCDTDRREKIILVGFQSRVGGGARSYYPRDLTAHQFFGQAGVFHLVADGHLETLAYQLGDVIFRAVVRHAAHGDGDALLLVARGQGDLQLARRHHRVLKK